MVFNWFRRKFSDSAETVTPAEVEQTEVLAAEEQPSTEVAEEPTSETPPASDYLNWAKAAYQNIQRRQQAAVAESSESTASDSPSPPPPAEAEPVAIENAESAAIPVDISPESIQPIEAIETPAAQVDETPAEDQPAPEAAALPVLENPAATETVAVTAPEVEVMPAETDVPVWSTEGTEIQTQPIDSVESSTEQTEIPASEEQPAPEGTVLSTTESTETPEPEIAAVAPLEEIGIPAEPEASLPPAEITEISPPPLEGTVDTAAEAPASLPFWARAEADRLARMERLQATASVVESPANPELPQTPAIAPLPEVEPVTSAAPEPSVADNLTFDEGFIWSAEVLAAQGRRPEDISVDEINWLQKLRRGLGKTRQGLVNQLKAVVGKGPLSQDAVLEIESLLLQADVGVEATDMIIQALQTKLRQEILPPDAAIAYLKQILRDILDRPLQDGYSPNFAPEKDCLNIWLMTGVNGVGKTTTIGKIAHVATESGYRCLIGAADTFRAAAVEQVKVWGDRSNVEVIANPGKNTDPAAVVFDAITAAQSRGSELLLVDTAGRLQNKQNLMEELRKIRRIVDKKAPGARIESLLVLDATLGQNGLRQAQVFAEAAQLSGVVITKLDGTAKGGVALAVVKQLGLPIRFIGAGEGIGDLRPFSSYEFVEALLSN